MTVQDAPNPAYMDPPEAKRLTGSSGWQEAHAVVYPALKKGSRWPVPTWNLRTQSSGGVHIRRVRFQWLPDRQPPPTMCKHT